MSIQAGIARVYHAAFEPGDVPFHEVVFKHRVPFLVPGQVLSGLLGPEGVDIIERSLVEFLVLIHALDVSYLSILLQVGVVPFGIIPHLKTLLWLLLLTPMRIQQDQILPQPFPSQQGSWRP